MAFKMDTEYRIQFSCEQCKKGRLKITIYTIYCKIIFLFFPCTLCDSSQENCILYSVSILVGTYTGVCPYGGCYQCIGGCFESPVGTYPRVCPKKYILDCRCRWWYFGHTRGMSLRWVLSVYRRMFREFCRDIPPCMSE